MQANAAIIPVRTVSPAFEPVSVAELREHEQFASSYTAHDREFARLIQAAREQWEHDTGCVCVTSRWTISLDTWPLGDDGIAIPQRPVSSIVSVSYLDTAGASTAWSSGNYSLDAGRATPRVWYAYQVTLPSLRSVRNSVVVTYQAGYATIAEIPATWKQAILQLASHWFNHRTPVVVGMATNEVPMTYQLAVQSNMRSTYP